MQIFTVLDKILNRMLARQHSFVVEEEHGFPKLPRPEGVKGQGFFVEIRLGEQATFTKFITNNYILTFWIIYLASRIVNYKIKKPRNKK